MFQQFVFYVVMILEIYGMLRCFDDAKLGIKLIEVKNGPFFFPKNYANVYEKETPDLPDA
ncbi:hypothetical protein HMPREF9136_1708 [Prevotella dentalis DSM 3688]|uniref:Uncharacterized protein n=2 Tax=Prevotellaceae TaxID=171552 RepID=F9D4D0_PREDD|nr:hypothetical protein HMPREF9136_1708 [Prevotella dentalis DSM 3688]